MNFTYNPLHKIGFQLDQSTALVIFKEAVSTYTSLPLIGNSISDARITDDTKHLYIWDGLSWIDQGTALSNSWSTIEGKPSSSPSEIDLAVSLASTALQSSVIDTDINLAANSDSLVPSQKAVKAYISAHGGTGIHFETLPPIFSNNAHAIMGGLVPGDIYRTGNSIDVLAVVH